MSDHASRCLELAAQLFESEEKQLANCHLKEFEDLKIDDFGMEHAAEILKQLCRASYLLVDNEPDEYRILEHLTPGRLLLSLSGRAAINIRSTTNPNSIKTGKLALVQEGFDRYLVLFAEFEVIRRKIKRQAWIYYFDDKVVLATDFYKTKRENQEIYIVQFGTAAEAVSFKDCFVKLNFGDTVITELFGPTPVDQWYARGLSHEMFDGENRSAWKDWSAFQVSILQEFKDIDMDVPEEDDMLPQRNAVDSCVLDLKDNWIKTLNTLLNSYVARSISVQVSEEVMKDIEDLEKDVVTLFALLPYCSCCENDHEPVETMIQNLNNIRWGMAEVKSMQRMNAFYQDAKTFLTRLLKEMHAAQKSFENGFLGEEDVENLPEASPDIRNIFDKIVEIEAGITRIHHRLADPNIKNQYYRFVTDKPTINMLPNYAKLLKLLCKKAANGTLMSSDFKPFDIIDAQVRFGKTFAFTHLRDLFWRKSDLEHQKIRATWHAAKEIFGKDSITMEEDEDGEKHVVDMLVRERILDRPSDSAILHQCSLKRELLKRMISRYADLMHNCLDFDGDLWTQLVDCAALLRKMAVPNLEDVAIDDFSSFSSEGASDEQADFEIISEQSSNFSTNKYERYSTSSYDFHIQNWNTLFDAETLAAFTKEDLRDRCELGSGSYGQVYLAKHALLKKVVFKEFINSQKEDILWELNTIKELQKSEYVLNLYGFLYEDRAQVGTLPIGYVMEYMPTSLRQVIHTHDDLGRSGKLFHYEYTLIQVLDQMRSLSMAFLALHNMNVIHRDVKPDNVLIDPWMHVRVCDFGSFSNPEAIRKDHYPVAGTPGYMSPEMISDDVDTHYDHKTDVYSLAITFWELLHREFPYFGSSASEIKYKTLDGERPKITSTACIVPLKKLIERCWKNDASARPSMKEIEEETDRIYRKVDKNQELRNTQIE